MIWEWLASTRELQEKTYGYDLKQLQEEYNEGALAEYIDKFQVAAVQELAELREEFSWKPWAVDEPFVNRDRILEETVDVMHFLGNILTGIGVTDAQFWAAYRRKQQKNRERQASGTYSAKKGGLAMGSEV